jgi:hypothetical protein
MHLLFCAEKHQKFEYRSGSSLKRSVLTILVHLSHLFRVLIGESLSLEDMFVVESSRIDDLILCAETDVFWVLGLYLR